MIVLTSYPQRHLSRLVVRRALSGAIRRSLRSGHRDECFKETRPFLLHFATGCFWGTEGYGAFLACTPQLLGRSRDD